MMRILHLAYEDPRQPGAGGGSVRTLEINRRLSERHEVTAIVSGYKGARQRIEHGVRWVPVGLNVGGRFDRLVYFAAVAPHVLTRKFDILVEDFGAPFSVGLGPLLTRRPVVASVQWLFAAEKAKQYGMPFDRIESAGLRNYRRYIAVSKWLARDLRTRRPDAIVEVIPNGIEPDAFTTPEHQPKHLLFVGRLDMHHKGGDLLLRVMSLVKERLGEATPILRIVGDGPDRSEMERFASDLRVSNHVEFCGRVEGHAKYTLMAQAHAVLMPSRYETFGMVAVEAQAAGAPVVTFNVGPLAEVAGPGGARLVDPFDIESFSKEVVALVLNTRERARLRPRGRAWAQKYDWDTLAERQESFYVRAIEEGIAT